MVSALALVACGDDYDAALEATTAGQDANVSFHMVDDSSANPVVMEIAMERGLTPAGTVLRPYPEFGTSLIIHERTEITEDCLKKVKAGRHPENNNPIINFKFDDRCTKLFGKLTSENIGRRFAVIVNDVIVTAPNIRTAIKGGSGFIEGGFDNMEEARELAYIINRKNAERRKTGAQ